MGKPPDNFPKGEGYQGMDKLTKEMGVGFYAYGEEFKDKGQIAAWSYNKATGFVEFWWSKDHCPLMCKECCNDNGSNEPGRMAAGMNPSATGGPFKAYTLTKKFDEDTDIKTGFGTVRAHCTGSSCVFKDAETGCTVDHIY